MAVPINNINPRWHPHLRIGMTNDELREMHRKYLDRDPEFDQDTWEKFMIVRQQLLGDKAYGFLEPDK